MHTDKPVPIKGEWRIPSNAVIRTPTVLLFEQVLEEGGIVKALAFLNARAGYRFTCVNRFEGSAVRNVLFFDRENIEIRPASPTQLVFEAYASLVHRFKKPFSTGNALKDARLTRFHARSEVLSYLGVPMWQPGGRVWGVLSHQDFVPHEAPKGEDELLTELAPVIAWRLRSQGLVDVDAPLSPIEAAYLDRPLEM